MSSRPEGDPVKKHSHHSSSHHSSKHRHHQRHHSGEGKEHRHHHHHSSRHKERELGRKHTSSSSSPSDPQEPPALAQEPPTSEPTIEPPTPTQEQEVTTTTERTNKKMDTDKDLENPPEVAKEEPLQDYDYPARLEIDYPEGEIERMETCLRIFKLLPVMFFNGMIASTLVLPTLIMILLKQKYPRWWFDFKLECMRFTMRFYSYCMLMTNKYPSTTDQQGVHLDIDYPSTLNQWAPLYKLLLAIPHILALFGLFIASLVAAIVAYISILITRRYPRPVFDFLVGVFRWEVRFEAYAILLATDQYPPFSLK